MTAESAATISVIIPTYNRAHVLDRAIRSVLSQTLPPHEVIVVDDGSTDGTEEVVAMLDRELGGLVYVKQENRGAPAARNAGIDRAVGDLIAFQDSDDEWHPEFLSRLAAEVRPRTVVFSSQRTTRTDGSIIIVPERRVDRPEVDLPRGNVASTQTVLVDRAVFDAGFRFDEGLRRFQDWDLWLSMLQTGGVSFVHVPEVLVEVRRLPDSISEGDRRIRDASLRRILVKHAGLLATRPRALVRLVVRGCVRPLVSWVRPLSDSASAIVRPVARPRSRAGANR